MVESTRSPRGRSATTRMVLSVLASAVGAGCATGLILSGHQVWAGLAALVGAAAFSATAGRGSSGLAAANLSRRVTFASRVMDPAFDALLLAPIAWVERTSRPQVAALAVIAMGANFVAAYECARASSLGYEARPAVASRAFRAGLLAIGLLFQILEPALWAVAALALTAAGLAALNVVKHERAGGAPDRPAEANGGGTR